MTAMGIKTQAQFIPIIADALGKSTQAQALSSAILATRILDFMNWGQERICRAYNFDELILQTKSPVTIAGQLSYPFFGTANGGWNLILPKDIEDIRLIDDQNSIKLERFHVRKFDQKFPYPSNFAWQCPKIYTVRGLNVELFKIPDQTYNIYITY